jgi:hypothetical protein
MPDRTYASSLPRVSEVKKAYGESGSFSLSNNSEQVFCISINLRSSFSIY